MCSLCCGGLFSTTKGSVYTKRRYVERKSDTRSVTTTVSTDETEKYRAEPNTGFSTSLSMQRQIANENIILEKIPAAHNDSQKLVKMVKTIKNECQRTLSEQLSVNENDSQAHTIRTRKLQRSGNVQDELDDEIHKYGSDNNQVKWNHLLRKMSYQDNDLSATDDTVVELKIPGKDHVEVRKQNGGNEAPYDFQAILRKTNSTRQSTRRFSNVSAKFEDESFIIAELLPNVVLEGTVYNL